MDDVIVNGTLRIIEELSNSKVKVVDSIALKTQGKVQSFNTIGVDLRKNMFSHGQLYVALSRVIVFRLLPRLVTAHPTS